VSVLRLLIGIFPDRRPLQSTNSRFAPLPLRRQQTEAEIVTSVMTNRGISPGAGENKVQFSAYG